MSEWLRRSTRILAFFWIFLGRDVATSAWKEFGRCPVQPARAVPEKRAERNRNARRSESAGPTAPNRHRHNKSKHKPYEAPSPSEELDDDEYATNPPNLGFFSTGGGASANRRFSTTGI